MKSDSLVSLEIVWVEAFCLEITIKPKTRGLYGTKAGNGE
jgi:hypothetical protein